MIMLPSRFREIFPEFASTIDYPETQVQFYLDIANDAITEMVWGKYWELGVALFTAHNLVLERQALQVTAAGGVGGLASGPVTNKSVGPASVGYNTELGSQEGAGNYNLTTYGSRFARYSRLFGAGGLQL